MQYQITTLRDYMIHGIVAARLLLMQKEDQQSISLAEEYRKCDITW